MLIEILNMGFAEIILVIVGIAFWGAVVLGVVYLIKLLFKRNETIVYVPINTFTENVGAKSNLQKSTNKETMDQSQKIALPQQQEIRYVTISDIVRCEASDSYTFFIIHNEERVLISRSLKEFSIALKPYGFMRTHQSHLVNPNYVKSWLKEDGGVLLLINGDKVPVSKPNREMVRENLEN